MHQDVLCLGDQQHLNFPSNFQVSQNSGAIEEAGVRLSSLSNFDWSGFSALAGSDMDGQQLHFLPPC
jgi:hypothetical protein